MPTAVPITAMPLGAVRPAADPAAGLARRVVILATVSFAIGFLGFLSLQGAGLYGQRAASAEPAVAVAQPAEPTPAPAAMLSADDWNLPKAI